jgi:hypothetical protein
MRRHRGPLGGFRRFFDRRPPLAPPPSRGLGGLGGPGSFGSPFGYGRDRTFRLALIGIVLVLIGVYLGRNWNALF